MPTKHKSQHKSQHKLQHKPNTNPNTNTNRTKSISPTVNPLFPPNINEQQQQQQQNNNYPPVDEGLKKHKSGYEWGLGIEHEFIPVIQIKNFKEYKDIYKILNNIELNMQNPDIINLEKEMLKIKNTFNFNIPVYYPDSYLAKHFPFSNMEWTGDKGFYMLETKNMNYKNITLNTLLKELNNNTKTILDSYNNILKTHFKNDFKENSILEKGFVEPNEGSIFYIYQKSDSDDYSFWNALEPKVLYKSNSQTKITIDTAGSYHFWITLPHKETDNHKSLHQRAAYLLQTIEPLLIAIYCSPDPRITSKNKKHLFAGSFRGAVNRFANYGTSLLQNYDDNILFNRQMSVKNIQQPGQINSDHYIFQIRNKYDKTLKTGKTSIYNNKLKKSTIKPKYMYLDDKLEKKNFITQPFRFFRNSNNSDKLNKYTIGLNIRRKENVSGFEFRIMDHLPETELKNLTKVIYLLACMSYEIKDSNNINLASANKGWNTMITNALFDGSRAKIDTDYIIFLEQQFNIKLNGISNGTFSNIIELLEALVNICWDKILKNKKNGLWLILEDDKTKPSIVSKNKEILDRLFL